MTNNSSLLPDVISESTAQSAPSLNWVGMEKIGLPVQIPLSDGGAVSCTASVDAYVSLDTSDKGIHMSRLYMELNNTLANSTVDLNALDGILERMLASHAGKSTAARLRLSFELPLLKPALLSENAGYQNYEIVVAHTLSSGVSHTTIELTIPYSSTCPCSASLARQLVAEAVHDAFTEDKVDRNSLIEWLRSENGSLATPHSQRSYAYLKLKLKEQSWVPLDALVLALENTMGTPVQTAVKREDEQAFARLNGSNLMFCEDAARRLKLSLEKMDYIKDYWFKVEHQESLHAHNAVVIDHN